VVAKSGDSCRLENVHRNTVLPNLNK